MSFPRPAIVRRSSLMNIRGVLMDPPKLSIETVYVLRDEDVLRMLEEYTHETLVAGKSKQE